MSAHTPVHVGEHHPGAREYIIIAIILTAITALEVAAWYVLEKAVLMPVLLVLSAMKFSLVVMFYMHLKFDNRLFTSIFVFGLCVAAFVIMAFIAIFHGFLLLPY